MVSFRNFVTGLALLAVPSLAAPLASNCSTEIVKILDELTVNVRALTATASGQEFTFDVDVSNINLAAFVNLIEGDVLGVADLNCGPIAVTELDVITASFKIYVDAAQAFQLALSIKLRVWLSVVSILLPGPRAQAKTAKDTLNRYMGAGDRLADIIFTVFGTEAVEIREQQGYLDRSISDVLSIILLVLF